MAPLPLIALVASALAAPGWESIGPERGHVVDLSANEAAVWCATRAGVLRADPALERWERDPRFPRDARRIAAARGDELWASPGTSLWHVAEETRLAAELAPGSLIVDMVVHGDRVLAAVRGEQAGVLAAWEGPEGLNTDWVLADVDPWTLASDGERVWLGTVERGLWASEDGRRFEPTIRDGGVLALGEVAGRTLAALDDGRLVEAASGATVAELGPLPIAGIVEDRGAPLLLLLGKHGLDSPLVRLEQGRPTPVPLDAFQDDIAPLTPTGLWPLDGGGAVIGSFRGGPIRVADGSLAWARDGFRAAVTGGLVVQGDRILLALMGTGTFLSLDGGQSWSEQRGQGTPVTDATAVVPLGDRLAVVDFEGVATLDSEGRWERWDGVPNPEPWPRNGLADLAAGPDGTIWGLDHGGGLWRRRDGSWQRCADGEGLQLDADAAGAVMLARSGALGLERCEGPNAPRWPALTEAALPEDARLSLPWLAAGGRLWRDGRAAGEHPQGRVAALAGSPDAALLALEDGRVLRCAPDGCVEATAPLPHSPHSLGWRPDGSLWLAEQRGSLTLQGGDAELLPWYPEPAPAAPDGSLYRLEDPPWMTRGPGPGGAPPPHPGPGPGHEHAVAPTAEPAGSPLPWWLLAALAALLVGGLGAGALLRRRR